MCLIIQTYSVKIAVMCVYENAAEAENWCLYDKVSVAWSQ